MQQGKRENSFQLASAISGCRLLNPISNFFLHQYYFFVLSYPEFTKTWVGLTKTPEFVDGVRPKERDILTLSEINQFKKTPLDLNNLQEVQWRAIMLCNISGACRPMTLKRLDWREFKFVTVEEDGVLRARVTISPPKSKTNQFGSNSFENIKDQRVSFTCGCPLGCAHDATYTVLLFSWMLFVFKPCDVTVLVKQHENMKNLYISFFHLMFTFEFAKIKFCVCSSSAGFHR